MARLNEPSVQVESVEALKRRFVRQNREIARVNSTQSIRIRTLENDISRLLSENIALREQVIKLQFEIDNSVGAGNVSTVKEQLEVKLLELGGLVQELGNVQQSYEDRRARRRRSGVKDSPKRSPEQRNWKNALTISEVPGSVDGRLPPIVEGKYYPRRTLDADELVGLLPTSGDPEDSPDLGPPPVAHFDAEDPIKFDAAQYDPQLRAEPEKDGDLNPALFANLETRRKRRGSSQRGEHTTAEPADTQIQEEKPNGPKPGQAWKSGAKRKFSAREDGKQVNGAKTSEGDNFQYNRNLIAAQPDVVDRTEAAPSQPEKQIGRRAFESLAGSRDRPREMSKIDAYSALAGRNVLAPKSVNTDPVSSPAKPRRLAEGEKATSLSHSISSKPRERNKSKDQAPSQRFARPAKASQPSAPEPKTTSQDVQSASRPPPETPAPPPLNALSPDGPEPPPARPESRDTPPPGDLDPETGNTNSGSMGRASRRQRGSVSYVEPNLRDKMRRPTKELVDAVAAEERLQQKKNVKAEAEREGTEPLVTGEAPSKMRTVVVKKEPTDDDVPNWKALPVNGVENDRDRMRAEAASPLGNKAPTVKADLPASVVTARQRRPSILDRERHDGEKGLQGSTAGSTIAALMTDRAKTRENSSRAAESDRGSRPEEQPGIYEVPESSPIEQDNTVAKGKESKPAVTRISRRHSSISDDRVKDALARRAERRKEGAYDGRVPSKTGGAPELKSVRSSAALGTESGEAQTRGERAASRRRSMML
ncbi:MAG: hypothetical protein Q9166_001564 [cf. Caloplaca sp. 2 TL-2023]